MQKKNQLKIRYIFFVVVVILIFGAFFCCQKFWQNYAGKVLNSNTYNIQTQNNSSVNVLPCNFYDKKLFEQAVSEKRNCNENTDGKIKGAVVPHHILASSLIADLFFRLSAQEIKEIILVGPNHYEIGETKIISSYANWQTPYGVIGANREFVSALEKKGLLSINDQILTNEHSISAILPFIKYYLPDVKITPLIISRRLLFDDFDKLSKDLTAKISQTGVVMIASVDFSHYLNVDITEAKDKETILAIKDKDYSKLFSFSPDNLDSPASLNLVMLNMGKVGTTRMEILNHTNSSEIIGSQQSSNTSYFELAFY